MEITKQSYLDLLSSNQQAWFVEGKYYTDASLIKEEYESLIEEMPYFLIYDYIDNDFLFNTNWPGGILFPEQLDTYLPKKSYIAFGERVKTIYFSNEDYNIPIIKVEYQFTRDDLGLLLYKTRTISWRKSNNTWCEKKKISRIPVSSKTEKLQEIKTRRSNIIDGLKGLAAEMGIQDRIVELFSKYQLETDLYIQAGTRDLYLAIENDLLTLWLNEPLPNGLIARDALLLHLQIGITEAVS